LIRGWIANGRAGGPQVAQIVQIQESALRTPEKPYGNEPVAAPEAILRYFVHGDDQTQLAYRGCKYKAAVDIGLLEIYSGKIKFCLS
jgi:hypothetical protein